MSFSESVAHLPSFCSSPSPLLTAHQIVSSLHFHPLLFPLPSFVRASFCLPLPIFNIFIHFNRSSSAPNKAIQSCFSLLFLLQIHLVCTWLWTISYHFLTDRLAANCEHSGCGKGYLVSGKICRSEIRLFDINYLSRHIFRGVSLDLHLFFRNLFLISTLISVFVCIAICAKCLQLTQLPYASYLQVNAAFCSYFCIVFHATVSRSFCPCDNSQSFCWNDNGKWKWKVTIAMLRKEGGEGGADERRLAVRQSVFSSLSSQHSVHFQQVHCRLFFLQAYQRSFLWNE